MRDVVTADAGLVRSRLVEHLVGKSHEAAAAPAPRTSSYQSSSMYTA